MPRAADKGLAAALWHLFRGRLLRDADEAHAAMITLSSVSRSDLIEAILDESLATLQDLAASGGRNPACVAMDMLRAQSQVANTDLNMLLIGGVAVPLRSIDERHGDGEVLRPHPPADCKPWPEAFRLDAVRSVDNGEWLGHVLNRIGALDTPGAPLLPHHLMIAGIDRLGVILRVQVAYDPGFAIMNGREQDVFLGLLDEKIASFDTVPPPDIPLG